MPRPTRTSRGEQPAGIRCARKMMWPVMLCPVKLCPVMLCPVMLCPANIARGVDSARIGEGRLTPPPHLDETRAKTLDKTRPDPRPRRLVP